MHSKPSDQEKLSMCSEYWSGIPVTGICKNMIFLNQQHIIG